MRHCYLCGGLIDGVSYYTHGGTVKQWLDERVQVLCCKCLDMFTDEHHPASSVIAFNKYTRRTVELQVR